MNDYSKITALYSRLSVGDEDRDGGESNSIQNQKKPAEPTKQEIRQLESRKSGSLKAGADSLCRSKRHGSARTGQNAYAAARGFLTPEICP